MVVLRESRPGSKRFLGDLTWEAAAAGPLSSTLVRPTLHAFYQPE